MLNAVDSLDVDIIEEGLSPAIVGSRVLVYKSTSSTNDIAWEYARNPINDGLAVFSESQSSGRGRRGNKWLSADGMSILCSILLIDFPAQPELLTTLSAVAVAEAIATHCQLDARIKWPNDVMINNKKIAGILLETKPGSTGNNYVIGIGVNVHQPTEFFESNELQMPATSLDLETGNYVDRNQLAARVLKSFDSWLHTVKSDPSRIITRWTSLSTQLGSHVTVEYDQQRFSGNCIGVDPASGLILQLDGGGVRMFHAAQTTIVKHL
jgi:BirA family biotin operon repressor/biotin-[acetyl-CoA-carboxylase] ligase